MAQINKEYLDLQGLQTYTDLMKTYARSVTSGIPEYNSSTETLTFQGGGTGPNVTNETLVFGN